MGKRTEKELQGGLNDKMVSSLGGKSVAYKRVVSHTMLCVNLISINMGKKEQWVVQYKDELR